MACPYFRAASKLAQPKAAASCRTPKLRTREHSVSSAGARNHHQHRLTARLRCHPSILVVRKPGYDSAVVSVDVTRMVPTRVTIPPKTMVEVIFSFNVSEEISTPRKGNK